MSIKLIQTVMILKWLKTLFWLNWLMDVGPPGAALAVIPGFCNKAAKSIGWPYPVAGEGAAPAPMGALVTTEVAACVTAPPPAMHFLIIFLL